MGHFLAVTAFQTDSPDQVADACLKYIRSHGVQAELLDPSAPYIERTDAQVFQPDNGWCRILWPPYFNLHDFTLVRDVCSVTGWAASTIHVYDSDYWDHLFRIGREDLHLYCSCPHYWQGESDEEVQRKLSYDSNPDKMCKALNLDVSTITPYLVDTAKIDNSVKAFEDDQFELSDYWVLADFWKRMGINYPDPGEAKVAALLRLSDDFGNLPASE